ncbi:MAG: hypothetical protein U0401_19045 [Anaerolineae bacterium]
MRPFPQVLGNIYGVPERAAADAPGRQPKFQCHATGHTEADLRDNQRQPG